MKNRSLLLYSVILILIVGILTTIVVATTGDSDLTQLIGTQNKHVGDSFIISYKTTLKGSTSVYCIQKDKSLGNNRKFILDKYVEIDGNEALIYSESSQSAVPDVVVDEINGQVAYILSKKQGYGVKDNETEAQKSIWHLTNAWTTTIFKENAYSWEGNSTEGKTEMNSEAEEYASSIGNLKSDNVHDASTVMNVVDRTNVNNISVMNVDEYYRIGPFRWQFDGNLQQIIVTGDVGIIDSSNVRFVKYSGTTPNIVEASDISTGEAFYVDINQNSGISKFTGLKLKTKESADDLMKIYKAKVWFFNSAEHQNVIFADVEEFEVQPSDGEGESSYDINFSISIGIKKVDDRIGRTPLTGVGFTFKATIQTYDIVGQTEHYKHVKCTHVSSRYIDDEGNVVTKYKHAYDSELDWIQYHYEWKDHTMYLDSSDMWSENDINTYYTNYLGRISLDDIRYPSKEIINETADGSRTISTARLKPGTKIIAEEVSNPYYGYSVGETYSIAVNHSAEIVGKVITNHQELVKISGYVWLDENAKKVTVRNDTYDVWEKGIDGITVYLKDTRGNIIKKTTTSELGIYSEIDGGEYRFSGVDLDALQAGNYYIEFEYCGITYQSVTKKLGSNKGSKAIDTATRNVLDRKFDSVDSTGSQKLNINGVKVNYSEINNHKSAISSHSGCTVYARTNEAGYDLYNDGFTPTYEEIRYVNLGLFEKAQADYALSQDLYNVKINVNGFSHIYRYATTRYNKNGSINEQSSWNMGVKFQNNNGSYDRTIYTSDSEYEASNHKDNEIKVYVTYKIALKNESSYLGRINTIVDYCDNRYNLISAGTSINDNDNITGNLSFSTKQSYNNEYSKYIINTNSVLEAGETTYIYVQFEINREAVIAILNNNELLNNVAEIYSYTTFKNNNIKTPVSVIDKDSVPGNMIPGQIDTYEDDTDAARSLKLQLSGVRTLSGTVFVDSTGKDSDKIYSGEERIGNGIFDDGEKTLSGIKVTLRETGKDDNSYDNERIEMVTYTDQNGNYKFEGYVPGDYILTYTWGDKTYKVQYYKGTIYDESRNQSDKYWYKIDKDIRKTDALDNREIVENVDNEMEALKYNTLENEINKAYEGGSDYIKQTIMNSSTPVMSLSVEYETIITNGTIDECDFLVENVDFGIVERPKQQLELNKRVSSIKLVPAGKEAIIDFQITEDGKLVGQIDYTAYALGMIKIEMDDVLIQGSTLETTYEMKVTNLGEIDYSSDKYYYFGNKTGAEMVKVSVTELLDYVDGTLSMIDNKWNEQQIDYLNKVNASQKDNVVYLNTTRSYMTTQLSKALVPGESNVVNMLTSKLLTTDNNTFDNQAEVVEITKSEAFNTGTPVKVNWVDDAETVSIIPNTGDNKGYVLPIMIGIITLVVLSAGIVVIKKFVVDNK